VFAKRHNDLLAWSIRASIRLVVAGPVFVHLLADARRFFSVARDPPIPGDSRSSRQSSTPDPRVDLDARSLD
jgi:hypothetical protein